MAIKVRPVTLTRWRHSTVDEAWKQSKPFVSNPRSQLCHRPKHVDEHSDGRATVTVHTWCGNMQHVPPEAFVDTPGQRLLCAACERKAVDAGELPAAAILGRHIHIGRLKPVRVCCTDESN